MSNRNRIVAELPKDWEDEYYRLKQQFDALKLEHNQTEEHNKMYMNYFSQMVMINLCVCQFASQNSSIGETTEPRRIAFWYRYCFMTLRLVYATNFECQVL